MQFFMERCELVEKHEMPEDWLRLHRPDLPLRLSSEKMWPKERYESLADFQAANGDLVEELKSHPRVKVGSVAFHGASARGITLPMIVHSEDGVSFSAIELLWRAHFYKCTEQTADFDSVGVYRSGIYEGVPKYYIAGSTDVRGWYATGKRGSGDASVKSSGGSGAARRPPHRPPRCADQPRGSIGQKSASSYWYSYYDINESDSHYEYLAGIGYQGGGPSWAGIVYGLLSLQAPAVLERVQFDPEGEGLMVWGKSRADLETIESLVRRVKCDAGLLGEAITVAKREGKME